MLKLKNSQLISFDCPQKIKISKILNLFYSVTQQCFPLHFEILFVTDSEIKDLNNKFRSVNKVTDVLSFPSFTLKKRHFFTAKEYKITNYNNKVFIGSLVLCLKIIKKQARLLKLKFSEYRNFLIVHGLLHLCGYDHLTKSQFKQMHLLEIKILEKIFEY